MVLQRGLASPQGASGEADDGGGELWALNSDDWVMKLWREEPSKQGENSNKSQANPSLWQVFFGVEVHKAIFKLTKLINWLARVNALWNIKVVKMIVV